MTEKHGRGSLTEYERYLQGMDASMRQKVALTAAHLLAEGRVADAGMGSGSGSYALAQLYPALQVLGVDLDPAMVELATQKYALPNLRFVVSDIGAPFAEQASLDGILDSSVLHHVSTFTQYSYDAVRETLAAQRELLRSHGVMIIRDFVAPEDEPVWLDVPTNDGDASNDPRTCSTAALFERFAREFRSLHATPGFSYERVTTASAPAPREGFARYATSLRHATEFILRKDYRTDWEAEVREEYCYFTQPEFERELQTLGMRVLASTPIHNPWIIANRYEGKVFLHRRDGSPLPFPPTNYIIVGQRVDEEGVAFHAEKQADSLGYLKLSSYLDAHGKVVDLVRRPNTTVDVLPWFEHNSRIYVLARTSYPRPILSAGDGAHALDGSALPHYVTEPITFVLTDEPLAAGIEAQLVDHVRLPPESLKEFEDGGSLFPSPGGLEEEVLTTFVRIDPIFVRTDLGARSGFSTSGRVHAIEAEQVLRAAQVGGLPDARLEMSVYALLHRLGRTRGPWIGARVNVPDAPDASAVTQWRALLDAPRRRAFRRTQTSQTPFMHVQTRKFVEHNAQGEPIAERALEYAVPSRASESSISLCVLRKHRGQILMGIVDDDRATAQNFCGHSNLLTNPAWRVPTTHQSMEKAQEFARDALLREHGVSVGAFIPLGGAYFPSAGATPERVHPFAVVVERETACSTPLAWVALRTIVADPFSIRDAHLRIAACRAAHAVGVGVDHAQE